MGNLSRYVQYLLYKQNEKGLHIFDKYFEEHLPGASAVHTLNLPGAGDRNNELSPLSVGEITDLVRDEFKLLCEREGGSWSVMGVSLGGMVTLDWCHRFPDDFQMASINAPVSAPKGRNQPVLLSRHLFPSSPLKAILTRQLCRQ